MEQLTKPSEPSDKVQMMKSEGPLHSLCLSCWPISPQMVCGNAAQTDKKAKPIGIFPYLCDIMINAKKYDKLTIIEDGNQKELSDVVIIPVWLLRSILKYDDELMSQERVNLTEYGQGKYDTLKQQHAELSINTERKKT